MNKLTPPTSPDRDSEEIVPLISYLSVLVGWWKEIALCTFLMAIGCGTLMMAVRILVPRYEASSAVALLRVTSNVAIDKKFSTGATGDAPVRRSGSTAATARRAAFVGMVKTGNVAQAVAERLSEKLGEKAVAAAKLLESIDAGLVAVGALSLRNTSDLIRITARADSPEKVAFIANAWAEEYVDHVNNLYRHTPAKQINMIQAEIKRTQEAYNTAQKELETFLAISKIESLKRTIERRNHAVTKLTEIWTNQLGNLLHVEEENVRRKSEAVSLYVETQEKSLSETYALRRALSQLLLKAEDLHSQTERGGTERVSAGNMLALMLLKTHAYSPTAILPKSLEISLDDFLQVDVSKAEFLTEIKALLVTLRNRLKVIDRLVLEQSNQIRHGRSLNSILDIDLADLSSPHELGLSQNIHFNGDRPSFVEEIQNLEKENETSPLSVLINNFQKEIRSSTAEVEMLEATRENLIQDRDVQRSALQTLQNEIVELKLAMSAFTSEVRLASHALVPVESAYPSALLIAGLGGIAGLLVVVSLAFLLNSQGSPPPLEKWRATRPGQNRDVG